MAVAAGALPNKMLMAFFPIAYEYHICFFFFVAFVDFYFLCCSYEKFGVSKFRLSGSSGSSATLRLRLLQHIKIYTTDLPITSIYSCICTDCCACMVSQVANTKNVVQRVGDCVSVCSASLSTFSGATNFYTIVYQSLLATSTVRKGITTRSDIFLQQRGMWDEVG